MSPLLLDLDGTLIDSRRDLATGVNLLLGELGLPTLPVETVLSFVGRGARSLIQRSIDHVDPSGKAPRDESTLRRFLGHYQSVLLDTTRPYPGVVEGLDRLQAAGVPLAVVSNKPEAPTLQIVEALGLSRYFRVVLGGDSTPTRKPDPGPLRVAAERLGVPLQSCVMVGDSDVDIAAAEAAGIPGVWCSWGGIHPDQPTSSPRVAHRFGDVVTVGLGPESS